VSKGYQQLWIRSDQVQKCHGKLLDGIFDGLGLQPQVLLHLGAGQVFFQSGAEQSALQRGLKVVDRPWAASHV
jgi:hypothetical protein